jgi:hypothetical protein
LSIINFGKKILNRPAGREAFLMAKVYIFKDIDITPSEEIIFDFDNIKVMTHLG